MAKEGEEFSLQKYLRDEQSPYWHKFIVNQKSFCNGFLYICQYMVKTGKEVPRDLQWIISGQRCSSQLPLYNNSCTPSLRLGSFLSARMSLFLICCSLTVSVVEMFSLVNLRTFTSAKHSVVGMGIQILQVDHGKWSYPGLYQLPPLESWISVFY